MTLKLGAEQRIRKRGVLGGEFFGPLRDPPPSLRGRFCFVYL